ncbi:MAG TPA: SigE family RNA polymerase sigma factor [Actinomycetota bacterium]|nr:SigE family RNA polymerase sigma factor [Actinomycetota bacterium]
MRGQERDREFRSFFFTEAPRLRRLALMLTGDEEVAADLTQDALVKAYRAWGRIRNADPGPYVRKTLVNLVRNQHRRRLVELRKQERPEVSVASHDRNVDAAMAVAQALTVLSPVKRAAILLRFYEDMSEAEIASTLDRPLNTVKSDIRRALDKLRPLLEEGATT